MTVSAFDFGAGVSVRGLAAMMATQLPSISVSGFPVAGQPLTMPHSQYTTLLDATARLLKLQHTAIGNLAPHSQGRLAELRGDPAAFPRFIADERFELAHAIDMARADVVIGSDGPRFIEFNVGGGFAGMVQFEVLRRLWREVSLVSRAPELPGENPFGALGELIRRSSMHPGEEPAVLFLISADDTGRTAEELATQCGFLRECGVAAEFADVRTVSPAKIMSSRPCPVAIVQLSEREALDAGWDLSRLLVMINAGLVAIPSQSARLVDSKKVLGLLSEGLPWMSSSDQAFVHRFVPWTRIVRDRIVRWRDRVCPVRQLLLAEQAKFVLKGSSGLSGTEVTFGAHCSPVEWAQLVEDALETEYYVAQEVVDSMRVPVRVIHDEDGTYDCATVKMVVSPFCIGGTPAGCHVRMTTEPTRGLITRGTGAFPGVLLSAPRQGAQPYDL